MYIHRKISRYIISDLLSDRIWSWRYTSPKNHRVEIALVVLMLPGLDWSRFKSSQSKYKEPQPKEQYLSFQICSHAFQVISLTKIHTLISCPPNRFRKVFQSFFVIHVILCMIDPTMLWGDWLRNTFIIFFEEMILILSRLSPSDTKPSSRLCLMLRKWSSMCLVQKLTKSPRTPSLPALKRYNAPGPKHQVRNHKEALYKLRAHTQMSWSIGHFMALPEYPEWWIWLFDQIPVVASEDLAVDVSTFSEVTQWISRAPAQTSSWLHVVLCDGQIPIALLSLLQIFQNATSLDIHILSWRLSKENKRKWKHDGNIHPAEPIK